jgi:hypothetical protein
VPLALENGSTWPEMCGATSRVHCAAGPLPCQGAWACPASKLSALLDQGCCVRMMRVGYGKVTPSKMEQWACASCSLADRHPSAATAESCKGGSSAPGNSSEWQHIQIQSLTQSALPHPAQAGHLAAHRVSDVVHSCTCAQNILGGTSQSAFCRYGWCCANLAGQPQQSSTS